MRLTIDLEASPGDRELLKELNIAQFLEDGSVHVLSTSKVPEEQAVPSIENEDLLPVPISLRFVWEQNDRRGCRIPRLVGIWMKSYGHLRGCLDEYPDEVRVKAEVLVPRPIAEAILGNDYHRFDLLPSGRR